MSLRRRKVVAAGFFLAALLAAGVYVYWLVSRGPKPARLSPYELVPEDAAPPEGVSFSTSQAVIWPHENRNLADRVVPSHDLSRSLPEGVVVVTDPPDDFAGLAQVYRETLDQAPDRDFRVKAGPGLTMLTVGPLLSQKEVAHVVRLDCRERRIELDIGYGVPRGGIIPVPQSTGWRPLAAVPLVLDAGTYIVEVNWSLVGLPADPDAPPRGPTIQTCTFTAPPRVTRSRTIRVNGADFQAVVDGSCPLPARGTAHWLHLALGVTNRGESDLYLDPHGFGIRPDSVQSQGGPSLRYWGGNDRFIPAEPVRVPPRWRYLFVVRGRFHWPDNVQALRLDGFAGPYSQSFWQYDGFTTGTYQVYFWYSREPAPVKEGPIWYGALQTKNASFQLVPE
jgi:hypothetical protein